MLKMRVGGLKKNPPNHCAVKSGGERSQKKEKKPAHQLPWYDMMGRVGP